MKKRWAKHVEEEILDYIQEHGWATFHALVKHFKKTLIDPPNPVRVRDKLLRFFLKGKLDRVRIRAFTFPHGREFVYYFPEKPPEWVIEEYLKEDSNKMAQREKKKHGAAERRVHSNGEVRVKRGRQRRGNRGPRSAVGETKQE